MITIYNSYNRLNTLNLKNKEKTITQKELLIFINYFLRFIYPKPSTTPIAKTPIKA